MKIEIDQSGKIENTNEDTVIAFTDEIRKSLLIRAKDKQVIQKIFRQIEKPRMFVYHTFTTLIYLLIKDDLNKIQEIIIDKEYPGKEALIKNLLLQKIRKVKPDFLAESISFQRVGKSSKVHLLAYAVSKNKVKPDLEGRYKEILKFIIK